MSGNRQIVVDGKRVKRHFISEWADYRSLSQADVMRLVDADRGTVSRWFAGSRPGDKHLTSLAGAFNTEPRGLFMHPIDFKILQKLETLTLEQKKRALELIELAFQVPSNKA